jgi:zinc finger-containing ubiquitin peptidase 1
MSQQQQQHQQQQQYQNNGPSSSNGSNMHSCEICGQSGFSDEKMIDHTQKCHVEGSAQCPFCGLGGTSSAELLLHVNQAHLDYLTPENELMSFIDDSKTPSGESDSMSCGLSPSIAEIPAGIDSNNICNVSNNLSNGTISKFSNNDNCKQATKAKQSTSYTGTNSKMTTTAAVVNSCNNNNVMDDNNNSSDNNNCDNNLANGSANGVQNHGEGSPLRSQLGLKLKANKPKITIPTVPSPLMCLMCPYTCSDPQILEEHINRSHFDPVSPGVNNSGSAHGTNHVDTLDAFSCPICLRCFENSNELELHVNHEHSDILSPAKVDSNVTTAVASAAAIATTNGDEAACNYCPVCGISFADMKTQDMELHIETHFTKSPTVASAKASSPDAEARKAQEKREFEMLRAQYGMDDQGNFREQSAVAMQRAVYAGEMSVADYYCRQGKRFFF